MRIVHLLPLTALGSFAIIVHGAPGNLTNDKKHALTEIQGRHLQSDDDVCIDDVPGILKSDICCPLSCGSCGGSGCAGRDGGEEFTGQKRKMRAMKYAPPTSPASWSATSAARPAVDRVEGAVALEGTVATISLAKRLAAEGVSGRWGARAPRTLGHLASYRTICPQGLPPHL
eukprot:g9984.t1